MTSLVFPEDFVWGVATSAQQIEGAHDADGRGESIWDRYASIDGNIADGTRPVRTCDHYHRWPEDIALMRGLGIGAYRFSTSWSRIMPSGYGAPNTAGLDFYDRLVDGLLAAGIRPCITLNHWDMPQVLENGGGWANREIVDAFIAYTDATTRRLGDRVSHWATHNEPWCIATLGYEQGCHAPGKMDPLLALRAAHHLLLSHGRAIGVIHGNVPEAEAGIVLNISPGRPSSDSEADLDAARQFDGFFNRWYLDPIFRGTYPEDVIEDKIRKGLISSPTLSFLQAGDLETIRTPIDFLGVNYYSRTVVKANENGDPVAAPPVPKEELTEMGWEVFPSGLPHILKRVTRDYAPERIYITENGAAFPDKADAAGRVRDDRRITYFRDHLAALHQAIGAGVPVKGYFAWSLLDNFEWGYGFTKRFGLYRVDFDTCTRTPKASADWFRTTVAANAVDDGR